MIPKFDVIEIIGFDVRPPASVVLRLRTRVAGEIHLQCPAGAVRDLARRAVLAAVDLDGPPRAVRASPGRGAAPPAP